MIICQVIGHVWATKKEPSLEGFKMMVVRSEVEPHNVLVAVDVVGAGIGEQVLVVSGSTARRAAGRDDLPVDAAIVGIIDTIEVEKSIQEQWKYPVHGIDQERLQPKPGAETAASGLADDKKETTVLSETSDRNLTEKEDHSGRKETLLRPRRVGSLTEDEREEDVE